MGSENIETVGIEMVLLICYASLLIPRESLGNGTGCGIIEGVRGWSSMSKDRQLVFSEVERSMEKRETKRESSCG